MAPLHRSRLSRRSASRLRRRRSTGATAPPTAGTVSSAGAGNFTVSGSHAYADEGSFTATVVLTDDAPGTDSATASSTVTVLDADTLSATATPVLRCRGDAVHERHRGDLQRHRREQHRGRLHGDHSLGRRDQPTGSVSGAAGAFTVTGSHTYFDEGVFTPTVFVADNAPGTASASAVGTAPWPTTTPCRGASRPSRRRRGRRSAARWRPSRTRPTRATRRPTSRRRSTGATEPPRRHDPGGGGGTFSVAGSHAYTEEGSSPSASPSVDDAPGTATATASGTAERGRRRLRRASTPRHHADGGDGVLGAVGQLHRPRPAQRRATSRRRSTGATARPPPARSRRPTGGPFTIGGSHTYAEEGRLRRHRRPSPTTRPAPHRHPHRHHRRSRRATC